MGAFHLAVIGRAFHWMDRGDTLARLDTMLAPRGALALFNTAHLDDPLRPWAREYRDVLARSPFAAVERVSVVEYRRVSAAQLRARPLSMSSLSRERLGERLDALLADIDALVVAHADSDDSLVERIESTATIAMRAFA